MVTKGLQTLNLKFDQVIFNSLAFPWEKNFEVTFGIFSVLVRDDHYFFIGGLPFLGLADNFFQKSNAFQTIFFITFCNEDNFLMTIFKKRYRLFHRSYLEKKTLLVHAYT